MYMYFCPKARIFDRILARDSVFYKYFLDFLLLAKKRASFSGFSHTVT